MPLPTIVRSCLLACTWFLVFTLATARAADADGLRGRVVDPHQRPVAGADVIVLRGPVVVTSVRTAADGQYGPVTLPAGAYEVVAGAPGLRSSKQTVRITAGRVTELAITLTLAAIGESVVVSAAQVETTRSLVSDAVTVVDRALMDQLQIVSAADALRLVPGFHLVTTGGAGGVGSIFPRGGESDYTLVLVDGVVQNVFGGGFDAAHLSTSDLDRLEVVRGPQSALYGGGAIGGIIHAVTRHGGPLRAHAAIETGGYGTTSVSGAASGSHGAWMWSGGLDWLRTDGDTREYASVGGPVANADYERTAGSGSLAWSDGPARRVRVDVRKGHNDRGIPGAYGSDPMGFFGGLDLIARGENDLTSAGASAFFRQGHSLSHRLQLTWADYHGQFPDAFGGSEDETRRLTARYQLDLEQRLPLSAGWEIQREQADNTFVTGRTFQLIPIKRLVSGWFVEARPVIAGQVFLNLGARLERIARETLEGDAFGSRPTFDAVDVVWSFNPKASVAWIVRGRNTDAAAARLLGWTRIRAGAGTGIKPPTTFEIAFTDNPSLKPERSRSLDVGVEQAIAGGTAVLDATWFHNSYDDLIVSVTTALRAQGVSTHRTDNISNARARGLEFGVTWRPHTTLAIRGGWTRLDTAVLGLDRAETDAPLPYVVGDRLIRRPPQQGSAAITWTTPRAGAFLMVNGRGSMLDLEPNFGAGACFGLPASCRAIFENPGYATTAIGASLRFGPTLEVFGRVANLFDRAYEEALGFPALGRSASVGIRVTGSR